MNKGKFTQIYSSHEEMLNEKNRRYGDSALFPLGVFTKHVDKADPAKTSILVRLDDKLSRIKNADELRKNDVSDVMGYLVLLCKSEGWEDFSDQID